VTAKAPCPVAEPWPLTQTSWPTVPQVQTRTDWETTRTSPDARRVRGGQPWLPSSSFSPIPLSNPHLALRAPSGKIKSMRRKEEFAINEYYHIYNRGVDKRSIVIDQYDSDRFIESLIEFNSIEPLGSLYEASFQKDRRQPTKSLVDIVCYCLNTNHFHLLLKQRAEGGVSKLLQKTTGGYSWYFNNKHKRVGALFQGGFKAKHIDDNAYLLHLSAYINLNNRVHQLGARSAKLVRSSWEEYTSTNFKQDVCKKDIVLGQFNNKAEYQKFALDNLKYMAGKRKDYKELENILLE